MGKVFISPCDVYLNDTQNVVQPNLLFVGKNRLGIIEIKGIMGAPNLIIEILSTNKVHDQQRKLELYESNNVPEYIIIDPDTKSVWHYIMQNGKYISQANTQGKLFIHQLNKELTF